MLVCCVAPEMFCGLHFVCVFHQHGGKEMAYFSF